MPAVLASASVTPPSVPLLAVKVTVKMSPPSASATEKSSKSAACAILTTCGLAGNPTILGAALTLILYVLVTGLFTIPSVTLIPILAVPALVAVKVASASALLI